MPDHRFGRHVLSPYDNPLDRDDRQLSKRKYVVRIRTSPSRSFRTPNRRAISMVNPLVQVEVALFTAWPIPEA